MEKLSIKSLQIGDWVTGKKWREKPFQITRINDNGKFIYGKTANSTVGPFFAEELEPIPLTPEILERNEFVNDSGIYCWRVENKQITYFSKENNRPYCTYPFVNIESGCIDVNELPMEYVHELQNALRLCGLNDLADHFKLED